MANEVECRRDSHPGKGRLIFRVGDIGRSIVPVFRPTPLNEDRRKTDLAYGGRVGTPGRVVNRRSMVSRNRHLAGIHSILLLLLVVVSHVRRPAAVPIPRNRCLPFFHPGPGYSCISSLRFFLPFAFSTYTCLPCHTRIYVSTLSVFPLLPRKINPSRSIRAITQTPIIPGIPIRLHPRR